MQYAGLKDKNGKRIYEGDIVYNLKNNFKGAVYYEKSSFWVREFYSNVDERSYDGDIKKETIWSINLDWKIIGNIYENPELLEKAA